LIGFAIYKSARVKILMELTLAITGASGTIYAQRTLQLLAESGAVETINLIMSDVVPTVAQVELGVNLKETNAEKINQWLGLDESSKLIRFWRLNNLAAKPASGSNKQAGMIIVPCSMGTLGAIASGAGTNLIHRAADVCLKEGRRLVLVPRETPFNQIHLENMLRVARAGATILAASPSFYHKPQTIDDLVNHLCFRILDQFDIPHSKKTQWTGEEVLQGE
jgi:4-hydroxy-3-polyprenylbenzoate decarboxylase